MRPQRRLIVVRTCAAAAALILIATAACRDAPDRAGQTADTAVLQDRRIAEGDVGRDTAAPDDSAASIIADTAAAPDEIILVLAADSAEGFLLYHRKAGCIACHGPDGEGLANLGPSLRDETWLHIRGTPREIAEIVRTGIARPREAAIAMPGLAARLEPEEIEQVAAYVYALSHPGAAVSDTAAARRDSLARLADTTSGAPRDTIPRPDAPDASPAP